MYILWSFDQITISILKKISLGYEWILLYVDELITVEIYIFPSCKFNLTDGHKSKMKSQQRNHKDATKQQNNTLHLIKWKELQWRRTMSMRWIGHSK